jgi:uncharacterized protein (UPF0218 family)
MQRERMNITSKHRIRVVMKTETEIITAGFTFVIHIGWLVVYGNAGRPSVSLSVRPTV